MGIKNFLFETFRFIRNKNRKEIIILIDDLISIHKMYEKNYPSVFHRISNHHQVYKRYTEYCADVNRNPLVNIKDDYYKFIYSNKHDKVFLLSCMSDLCNILGSVIDLSSIKSKYKI